MMYCDCIALAMLSQCILGGRWGKVHVYLVGGHDIDGDDDDDDDDDDYEEEEENGDDDVGNKVE